MSGRIRPPEFPPATFPTLAHLTSGSDMTTIKKSYIICTTPRSGSNFLCEMLQATEVAGRPDEFFWKLVAPHLLDPKDPIRARACVVWIRYEGTTSNGVFGIKQMRSNFGEVVTRLAALTARAESSPPEILAATFPNLRYIWLTRQDKVRQGISWWRALKTERWRSTDTAAEAVPEPIFDVEAIASLVEEAATADRDWRDFFQNHGIEPLVVSYEELERDPARACHRVLDFLQLPPPPRSLPRTWQHQWQADDLTEDWVRRYHTLKDGIPGE
jgi:LPS sulfotransferase NodH